MRAVLFCALGAGGSFCFVADMPDNGNNMVQKSNLNNLYSLSDRRIEAYKQNVASQIQQTVVSLFSNHARFN